MGCSTSCFAPVGDSETPARRSAEELWTGVEVRRDSCVRPIRLLPLLGVLGKKLAPASGLPGRASTSSVSEATFSVDFLFVFRDPPSTPFKKIQQALKCVCVCVYFVLLTSFQIVVLPFIFALVGWVFPMAWMDQRTGSKRDISPGRGGHMREEKDKALFYQRARCD